MKVYTNCEDLRDFVVPVNAGNEPTLKKLSNEKLVLPPRRRPDAPSVAFGPEED